MKIDQTCPYCGTTEAKGAYCTRCLQRTEPSWLHRPPRGGSTGRFIRGQSGHASQEKAP